MIKFPFRLRSPRVFLSHLAIASVLLLNVSGPGAQADTGNTGSAAAITITVGQQQVTFQGQPATGAIVTSANGEDYINPGFDFASGKETGGFSTADLGLGTDSSGQPTLSGNVEALPSDGNLAAPPTQGTVTVSVNEDLVVLTTSGSYVLVEITAASPQSVKFTYLTGTLTQASSQSSSSGTLTLPSSLTVGQEQVSFQGQPTSGTIVTSANGEDYINPGFSFNSGKETGGFSGADLGLGTDSSGQPTLSGNVVAFPQDGNLDAAPTQQTVTVAAGDQLVVLTNDGTYVVVAITAASPQSVHFQYLAGTVQSSVQLPSTLTVGKEQVTFQGQPATGTIVTSANGEDYINPGFSLATGQKTGGLESDPDLVLGTDSSGQPTLSGNLVALSQAQDGSFSAPDLGPKQTVTVAPGDEILVLATNGVYYVVAVTAASPEAVQLTYLAGTPATPWFPASVSIGGQTVTFQGQPLTGTIVTAAKGEAYINPGFDFASGQETSGLDSTPDVTLDSNGSSAALNNISPDELSMASGSLTVDETAPPTFSGELAGLSQAQDGTVSSAAPTSEKMPILPGDLGLVQTTAGDYVLVAITAASTDLVQFEYLIGTTGQPTPPAVTPGTTTDQQPPSSADFTDLSGFDWAASAIQSLAAQGIIKGVGHGNFDPSGTVSRAQMAALMQRMFNLPTPSQPTAFSDVPAAFWGYNAVEAASPYFDSYQIPGGGYAFNPGDDMNRQDVAEVVVKIMVSTNQLQLLATADAQAVLANVTDASDIAPSLQVYVATAIKAGILKGYPDGTFHPLDSLTRAQIAVLLQRLKNSLVVAAPTTGGQQP